MATPSASKITKVALGIALVAATATGLAACSSNASDTSGSETSEGATLIGPTTVDLANLDGSDQTLAKAGDILYINLGQDGMPEDWTATVSDPSVLQYNPGRSESANESGEAPTFTALKAGTTKVTFTDNMNKKDYTFNVTVG